MAKTTAGRAKPTLSPDAIMRQKKRLDAALGEAEAAIDAVRTELWKARTVEQRAGGRSWLGLQTASARIRKVQQLIGGKPCGGGRPCDLLEESQRNIESVQEFIGGRPCGGGKPCGL